MARCSKACDSYLGLGRRSRLTAALIVLIIAQVGAYKTLQDSSQRALDDAVANARPLTVPVVAENPDHAEQLRELRRLQDVEQQASKMKADLAERDAEIERLKLALGDKARADALIGGLTELSAQLTEVRDGCRTLEPTLFLDRATRAVERAIGLLQKHGLVNDAQRLADGRSGQMFGGRYATPNCEPYQENSKAILGIQVRLMVIDEIVDSLRR